MKDHLILQAYVLHKRDQEIPCDLYFKLVMEGVIVEELLMSFEG